MSGPGLPFMTALTRFDDLPDCLDPSTLLSS